MGSNLNSRSPRRARPLSLPLPLVLVALVVPAVRWAAEAATADGPLNPQTSCSICASAVAQQRPAEAAGGSSGCACVDPARAPNKVPGEPIVLITRASGPLHLPRRGLLQTQRNEMSKQTKRQQSVVVKDCGQQLGRQLEWIVARNAMVVAAITDTRVAVVGHEAAGQQGGGAEKRGRRHATQLHDGLAGRQRDGKARRQGGDVEGGMVPRQGSSGRDARVRSFLPGAEHRLALSRWAYGGCKGDVGIPWTEGGNPWKEACRAFSKNEKDLEGAHLCKMSTAAAWQPRNLVSLCRRSRGRGLRRIRKE
ncbi:hypothetical protein GGX14DRAFT_658720 [Mycena pura]|uniref:Uncharacterized protein n=1 Tax=Mycena pura TaxID=153505 RepID=A0AAD6V9Q5_9AGAR|nr:hypothetical protein GGX14DRAFT_658720 [Mycena pura]